jgi:hypothetical protein
MVRKSLLVIAALVVAAPLSAQEDVVWSSQRPDGHAPLGVYNGRTLSQGEFQISYRFSKMDDRGIWVNNDSLPLSFVLDQYDVVPLTQNNLNHEVELGYGVTDDLTVLARIRYRQMQREQLTKDYILYVTEANELGDTELSGLYNVFRQGPYTAHVTAGLLVPTGQNDVSAETPGSAPFTEPLAYDMRPGEGVFAFLPGMTAQVQNEAGSVGAQVAGRVYFGTNDAGYTPGDRLAVTGWAAYHINESFSISARLDYQTWNRIEGMDPGLDPLSDPSNDGYFAEGSRLSIPLGINFLMPDDSRFAGHRLAIEYIHPIDQKFDGPQLGFSRGLVVGWQAVF